MNKDKTRLSKQDNSLLVMALSHYADYLGENYNQLKDLRESVDELGQYFYNKCEEHDRPVRTRYEVI